MHTDFWTKTDRCRFEKDGFSPIPSLQKCSNGEIQLPRFQKGSDTASEPIAVVWYAEPGALSALSGLPLTATRSQLIFAQHVLVSRQQYFRDENLAAD